MIVKNVSGENRYFSFVPRGHVGPDYVRGRLLANGASATLPDYDENILKKVNSYVAAGALQITTPPAGTFGASVNLPASGNLTLTVGGAVNGDVLTIGGLAFKVAADPGTGVLGKYYSSLTGYWAGATNATSLTAAGNLVTAINANSSATGIVADPAFLIGTTAYISLRSANGATANTGLTTVVTTNTSTRWAASGAVLAAGVAGSATGKAVFAYNYTVVAGDVSAGFVILPTALPSIGDYTVKVETSAGGSKAWDGATTVSGSTLIIDNSGSTDWAATDIISVFAESE